jgi:lipopolysaccharide/colanic/teichoic acid biosynthesis glycosyltransferase
MLIHRVPVLLMIGGVFSAVLILSEFHAKVVADPAYDFTASFRLPWALTFAFFLSVAAYSLGLPDVPRRARQILASSVVAATAGTAAVSLAQLIIGSALLPRFVVVATWLALPPWLGLCAVVARGGKSIAGARDRVVVIGDQEDSKCLMTELDDESERPGSVVAVLSLEEATPRPGSPAPIRTIVDEQRATVVVLDREAQSRQPIVDQVALLHEGGIRIRTLSLFYEEWLGKLPLGELERVSLMFDIGEIHRLRYGRLKRLVDVGFATAMLPVLGVSVPLIWLVNLVGNRGPLFYSQPRVGKGGEVFSILKFRTMQPGDGQPGDGKSGWADVDDDRVTPVGQVLRATHLDELPQLVNVLRGDLSLVGPRPEQPHYVEQLESKLPYYQLRHLVQPGVTGWAQVKFRYGRSEGDALEKLQYEFYYLRRQALALDLRIVARTFRAVLPTRGETWR